MKTLTLNKKKITINNEQELYVIPCGDGYSCLGFDVCLRWTEALFNELRSIDVLIVRKTHVRGSMEAYDYYQELTGYALKYFQASGYRFQYQLEPRLMGLEGKRVEVTDKDGEKRQFRVGKSCGFIPVHLEIEPGEDGGPAVTLFSTDTLKVLAR